MSYHTSSGGSELNPVSQLGSHHFFSYTAILPADIMWQLARVEMYQEGEAEESRRMELDSIEEERCNALVQSARYLQGVQRYHDRNVQERSFNIGDLVLRRIQNEDGLHKF